MVASVAVSIIIPVYNAQAHIAACIDSARAQTLQPIEILCVDDGSTDQSMTLLTSLATQDNRIRVFRQPNRGAGSARNLAMSEAKGEFLSFLDADDRYASDTCLQELYSAAKRLDVSICGGFRQLLHPDGSITLHSLFRRELKRKPQGIVIPYADFQYDYHYQNFLFRRDLLEQHQISFPPYRRFQDPPFFVRAMIAAGRFAAVPIEVYLYRLSERPLDWNAEKVAGLLQGLTDDLILSREANLPKLHARTVQRLEEEFAGAITGQLSQPEVYELCLRANAAIDVRLLPPARAKQGEFLLLPLQLHQLQVEHGSVQRSSQAGSRRRQPIAGLIRCIREHGVGYTIRRGIEHLGIPMNAELRRTKQDKKKSP